MVLDMCSANYFSGRVGYAVKRDEACSKSRFNQAAYITKEGRYLIYQRGVFSLSYKSYKDKRYPTSEEFEESRGQWKPVSPITY